MSVVLCRVYVSVGSVAADERTRRKVGMSRDGLYKALSEDGNPTWSTILKVTHALGLRFELHFVA
ncbi:putative addiction module antidote protein [Branchiibius hedensis]|uniref:Probable addiction module antidote protein n=1 Tax=Branchiibius hedensis TaxID=672460 RepID=A0A2Y8ZPC3_9MICO|nr:hypothetical protein [Branchiibius hedensis]PWJ24868.1 putative addiction module antidote protein [Branchiibius hedensis]SSA33684.1 probable addiction module antidote protein [Branchiibius hedensis]